MFTTPPSFAKIMLGVSLALFAMSLIGGAHQLLVFYSSLCVILSIELVREARKA
jgi:hypothetical protein